MSMSHFLLTTAKYLAFAAAGTGAGLGLLLYVVQNKLIYPANMPSGECYFQEYRPAAVWRGVVSCGCGLSGINSEMDHPATVPSELRLAGPHCCKHLAIV